MSTMLMAAGLAAILADPPATDAAAPQEQPIRRWVIISPDRITLPRLDLKEDPDLLELEPDQVMLGGTGLKLELVEDGPQLEFKLECQNARFHAYGGVRGGAAALKFDSRQNVILLQQATFVIENERRDTVMRADEIMLQFDSNQIQVHSSGKFELHLEREAQPVQPAAYPDAFNRPTTGSVSQPIPSITPSSGVYRPLNPSTIPTPPVTPPFDPYTPQRIIRPQPVAPPPTNGDAGDLETLLRPKP